LASASSSTLQLTTYTPLQQTATSNNTMEDTTKFRSERADSTASSTSAGSASASPPRAPTSPTGRRSSQGLFVGLTAQKRKEDPISIARRQSLSDQRPKPGFIGKMWNTWVYGS